MTFGYYQMLLTAKSKNVFHKIFCPAVTTKFSREILKKELSVSEPLTCALVSSEEFLFINIKASNLKTI